MTSMTAGAAALVGYLAGSLSMARLVVRLAAPGQRAREGIDVALDGSDKTFRLGTVSASSVSVQLGARYGFVTYLLDVLKVFLPVLIFKLALPGSQVFLVAAVAGLVGHCWPVWHRFRGGRGISAVYAGLLAIDWLGFLVTSLGGALLGFVILRDMLSAYLASVLLIIPWIWFRTHDTGYLAYALVVNAIFLAAMIPEIRRWIVIRREKQWDDVTEVMQLSGMGRGLLRLANKLGWIRKEVRTPRPLDADRPPSDESDAG